MNSTNNSFRKTPGIKGNAKFEEVGVFKAPEGFWVRCPQCHSILQQEIVRRNAQVCTECGHHYRMSALDRIALISDEGTFKELDAQLEPRDFLGFFDSKSYQDRLAIAQKKTGLKDAFVSGEAKVKGRPVQVGAFEFSFMGGSMGTVVGEKISRLFERALQKRQPAVLFQSSGGARMQEGLSSLMQMAKTLSVLAKLNAEGIPYVSILTDPTTGGVAASFALLGDVNIAEPNALVGFAGPRVIEQTINEKLPKDFQRAEFLLAHGMIDNIVPRSELKSYLSRILGHLSS
jgi:acetyl-CoA carboxylase carboxyl transferase subunit beta